MKSSKLNIKGAPLHSTDNSYSSSLLQGAPLLQSSLNSPDSQSGGSSRTLLTQTGGPPLGAPGGPPSSLSFGGPPSLLSPGGPPLGAPGGPPSLLSPGGPLKEALGPQYFRGAPEGDDGRGPLSPLPSLGVYRQVEGLREGADTPEFSSRTFIRFNNGVTSKRE